MSDFNSSLPVRTETNGDVVSKIVDYTINTNGLAITAAGAVTDVADGPVTPGPVASNSELIGGQYNAVLPVLADTEQAAIQVDSSGRLLVAVTSTDDHNYGVVGANTLRTAAQIGNATGAADFNVGATSAQTLRVEGNQGAPNTVANAWPTLITDGTDTALVTAAGELSVLSTAQPGVDIGDVTVNNGAGAAAVNIQDGGNSITVDGTVSASNFPTTVDTNYGVVGANTIRTASQIGNATGAADFNAGATGAQTLRVEANQGAPTTLANAWPTKVTDGTDLLLVNADGSINVVVTDASPGTSINDYKRVVALAAAASDNHDYTVTAGKTLQLNQIESTGSGKAKMQVDIETGVATGVFVTRWTQFNSTGTPNMVIHIDNPIPVAAGVRVRVIMTNKDLTAQDLYSTISGYELP